MDGLPGIMPSSVPGWPSGWLASVRAAVHGDGEENIASFARWCPASAAQFAG